MDFVGSLRVNHGHFLLIEQASIRCLNVIKNLLSGIDDSSEAILSEFVSISVIKVNK